MRNAIAIFGYNNTRIYDVKKIKSLIHQYFQAEVILVKDGITDEDFSVTPYCLDVKLETTISEEKINSFLSNHHLQLIGCLPFSDKGVISGSFVAKNLSLFADDFKTSFAMLDKNKFRELEEGFSTNEKLYKKPFFIQVRSENELYHVLEKHGSFFIKPTSEGNSRGCMKITSLNDLQHWLKDNDSLLNKGVICEEILSDLNEYSFDGVGGKYWITKKYTTQGSYRAEYQHIVPAPLSIDQKNMILQNMRSLLPHLGSRGGAFHHEFFLFNDGRIASVEPNRRPAGMWIWDLAQNSFKKFDPWMRWVEQVVSNHEVDFDTMTLMDHDLYTGVRGVIAPKSGKLLSLQFNAIENDLKKEFGDDYHQFSFLKKVGDYIRHNPKDNSDFLALVSLQHQDWQKLEINLEKAEKLILKHLEIEV